jgi:hypothetical protein
MPACDHRSIQNAAHAALATQYDTLPNAHTLANRWTGHMYSRLRDGNVTVRKNAVMVLTHLILNDMIKIKGQVRD